MRLGANCRNSPSHWSRAIVNKFIDNKNNVPCNTTVAMSEKKIYLVQTIAKLEICKYSKLWKETTRLHRVVMFIVDVIYTINKVIDKHIYTYLDKVTVIWPTTKAFVVLCSVNPDILLLQTERNLRSGRMGVFKSNPLITAASVIGKLFILHVSNHPNFSESDTPESFFPLSS